MTKEDLELHKLFYEFRKKLKQNRKEKEVVKECLEIIDSSGLFLVGNKPPDLL